MVLGDDNTLRGITLLKFLWNTNEQGIQNAVSTVISALVHTE